MQNMSKPPHTVADRCQRLLMLNLLNGLLHPINASNLTGASLLQSSTGIVGGLDATNSKREIQSAESASRRLHGATNEQAEAKNQQDKITFQSALSSSGGQSSLHPTERVRTDDEY